ncbi:hypothetical protein BKA70DRAFT_1264849 [Coprinopsis sp. MPI-PUGE-AT-0042]|nr:hypothetical protein BKA70DRAFT_1264849 [Coprinopsis sp. MPI-PUGE-AT-0042]
MQLKLSHLAYIASVMPLLLVEATDICAYTSRSCIGNFGCCSNVPAGTCCQWGQPSGYGWSVRWQNAAVNWFGTTYGDINCGTQTGGLGTGAGSPGCLSVFNAPNYINWGSARWVANGARQAGATEACQKPDTVGYTDAEGKVHAFKVPEDRLEEAFDLIEKEAFTALEEFEAVDAAA